MVLAIKRLLGMHPRKPEAQPVAYTPVQITHAFYEQILGRAPDAGGLRDMVHNLESGAPLADTLKKMLLSGESARRRMQEIIPGHTLPNLRELFPAYYRSERHENGAESIVFQAASDAEFNLLEDWIRQFRYYDVPGVWGAAIDTDKRVTAALAQGLGAKSCLEIGCFAGPVLSLLKDAGVDVVGLDASHLAFVLAFPKVRENMLFGDLLTTELGRKFDVIVAMDILEHLNPVRFDRYLGKIAGLIEDNGYVLVNSPMLGNDDVFGTVLTPYLREWKTVGDAAYWRDIDCDQRGWPAHGHLVWASPAWWEQAFAGQGLVRDREIEIAVHRKLEKFFARTPGRKSFFILKRAENHLPAQNVMDNLIAALDRVENLDQ